MLFTTSPGTSPSAAAGMLTAGGGIGPGMGGIAGLRRSADVAEIRPSVGDGLPRLKDGLVADAFATIRSRAADVENKSARMPGSLLGASDTPVDRLLSRVFYTRTTRCSASRRR